MADDNFGSDQSSNKSTNRLVKILIAVGIGIPVIIELMTVFNLINVQIFGNGDDEEIQQKQSVVEVQRFTEGDTLFADYTSPVFIDEMRVKVSAQQWRFALRLVRLDTLDAEQQVKIDSLQLQSGQTMDVQKTYQWQIADSESYLSDEWMLPNGDIPVIMYISSDQPFSDDSTEQIQQEVKLDNLPVRYNVDE